MNYCVESPSANLVVEEIERAGGEAFALAADVSRRDEAEMLVSETVARFGSVDVLVYNAGIWRGSPIEEMSDGEWAEMLEVNLTGTFQCIREAVPHMKEAGYGRIVNIASTAGQRGEAFCSHYAATKGGVIALVRSLAVELAPIRVNAVAPGWIRTDMTEPFLRPDTIGESLKEPIPLGQPGHPEDVAGPVAFLASTKHFSGRGGSDRLPEQEIATVRKSLEQLKQIELAPFFTVTGNAPDLQSTVDGLLVSHIRYQGFQGNIRATTHPVSFDAAALSQILALPQFTSWRQSGGLMISDDLGSQAVRQFYTQGAENFLARLVARDAFLAGNDLLYLGNILSSDAQDTYAATVQVLDFFAQEYRSDPAFAQLVDTAVVRILMQKYHLYSTFTISNVITPEKDLEVIGTSQQPSFDVARSAATLISPDPQELSVLLPTPPQLRDHIVFLTDTAFVRQCSSCSLEPTLPTAALEQAVVRLYGPNGSGQVFPSRLSSYPFDEVKLMLDGLSKSALESDLSRATWVVLSLADVGAGQLDLLRRVFSERPDLIQSKNVTLIFSKCQRIDDRLGFYSTVRSFPRRHMVDIRKR